MTLADGGTGSRLATTSEENWLSWPTSPTAPMPNMINKELPDLYLIQYIPVSRAFFLQDALSLNYMYQVIPIPNHFLPHP
ncbi:hypothetical protein E2562_038067 [Oryza meyeriana var. granulata]|uniref:Uncharacterized protein n=1 Tax=Oryza meyeriana var. granulata TaxID=110450 RepID=A0A6G1EU43_9ORYZ|nr:hypothetical protein E2562_038067 [Oryza meyeriana var. granulata]